jgi:hypothetical protein
MPSSSAFHDDLKRGWDRACVWRFHSDQDHGQDFDSELGLLIVLQDLYSQARGGWVEGEPLPVHVRFFRGGQVTNHELAVAYPEDGAAALLFPDGTSSTLDIHIFPPGLDQGPALMQPITIHEYASIERLLGLLWEAAARNDLSEGQVAQIEAIHALISRTHRETVADKSPRWKLVGVIGEGLKLLLLEGLSEVLGAVFIDTLQQMGWLQTVAEARRLLKRSNK